jgi:hypothetical protein
LNPTQSLENEEKFFAGPVPNKSFSGTVHLPKPLVFDSMGTYNSEFKYLNNLWRIMVKLFIGIEFESNDFIITKIEENLLKEIVKKKKFSEDLDINLNELYFNKIKNANLRKKTEDSLKFIFKKALLHLKKKFHKEVLKNKKISNENLDECFYDHYFGEISKMFSIPIESFYHFRNWKKRTSPHIPKSITKRYVSRLKLNREFILKFKHFLEKELDMSFFKFNSKKIRALIIKWEKKIEDDGVVLGLSHIISKINSKGNKFPWTSKEVLHARNVTFEYLKHT